MNDLSRSQTASRLSEDIGDVLGAIRRLIAEDAALGHIPDPFARLGETSSSDSLTKDDVPAARHGGAAALARRMVQNSAHLREAQGDQSDAPSIVGERVWTRRRLVADPQQRPARPATPVIIARRDYGDEAPLRLQDTDRVGSVIDEGPEVEQVLDSIGIRGTGPETQPDCMAEDAAHREHSLCADDFAEAFDAKARMRPDVTPLQKAAPKVQMDACANTVALADAPPQIADPFLQAYTAQAADDPWQTDDLASIEAQTVGSELATSERRFGLTIPSCLADDKEVAASSADRVDEPEPEPECFAGEAASDEGTEVADSMVPDASDGVLQPAQDPVPEATIREVIRELIQEELHGDLGQRFSRNLRAVIRREVAAAIDEHLERL